jgi:hypothetical protein
MAASLSKADNRHDHFFKLLSLQQRKVMTFDDTSHQALLDYIQHLETDKAGLQMLIAELLFTNQCLREGLVESGAETHSIPSDCSTFS